jgi:ABC-2 type transport system permease protein
MLAVASLWHREVIRFLRQRSRVTGALVQPLLFWLLLGGGLGPSFRPPGIGGGSGYLAYLYPGILVLVLLFTAIFATIAIVEDRRSGFLQGVLVAPVSRTAIVVGQSLGSTTLAVGQGAIFLALAPFVGIPLGIGGVLGALAIMTLVAFALTNLGLIIAWRMESTQGFHAIMNLILLPIWLLSGAFFPSQGVPAPLATVMQLNPLTYGLAALRRCLATAGGGAALPSLGVALTVTLGFAAATLGVAVLTARRSSTL